MFDEFLTAQQPTYVAALSELRAGRKRTHWMWFIFPQIAGLGFSETSRRFALASPVEARVYLAHPVLGARLRECTESVLTHPEKRVADIFGSPDDLKFHSSMTLFACAAPGEPLFGQALQVFFAGKQDQGTLARL